MSLSNQMSSAASKVTLIRRVKNRKSAANANKNQSVSSIVHQSKSNTALNNTLEVPRYMNTYCLEPKKKFSCSQVYAILEEVVNKYCFGVKYDPIKSSSKVQILAGEIMKRIKKLDFDRYKLIVVVEIGSNKNQEIVSATKFLWDASKDRYATYSLKSGSMYTCATSFGIYLD